MGHLVGKDLYRRLGKKIDGLSARAPWNAQLYAVLKELYSEDDADVVIRMPYGLSTLDRLEKATGIERARLERQLASLCSRGLVIDLVLDGKTWYAPSPMVAVRVSELERLPITFPLSPAERPRRSYSWVKC